LPTFLILKSNINPTFGLIFEKISQIKHKIERILKKQMCTFNE